MNMSLNSFTQCGVTQKGGVFTFKDSKVQDYQSIF